MSEHASEIGYDIFKKTAVGPQAETLEPPHAEAHPLETRAVVGSGSEASEGVKQYREAKDNEKYAAEREAETQEEIQGTLKEIEQLSKPQPTPETSDGVLGHLGSYCSRIAGAIGGVFRALFNVEDPNLAERRARVEELQEHLSLSKEQLKEWQDARARYHTMALQLDEYRVKASPEHKDANYSQIVDRANRTYTEAHNLLDTMPASAFPNLFKREAPPETAPKPEPEAPADALETKPDAEPSAPHRTENRPPERPVEPGSAPSQDIPADTPIPEAAPIRPENAPTRPETPSQFTPRPVDGTQPVENRHPNEAAPPHLPAETPPPTSEATKPEGAEARDLVRDVGDPQTDRNFLERQGQNDIGPGGAPDANTCGVVTQEMILNKLEGNRHRYTENELAHEAVDRGWFDHGTTLDHLGSLIEAHGHPVERKSSTLTELAARLEKGDEAIVAVNAGMLGGLWAIDPTSYGRGGVNHAVWISGAKVHEHDGQRDVVSVYVVDSGTGQAYEVDAATFEKAWATGGHFAAYVAPGKGA